MKNIINILIASLILIVFPVTNIYAQLDNSPFYRYQKLDAGNEGDLMLSISHLSFNKDNEYFNHIADGYTLFGNQFKPTLVYFSSKNIRIEGGIYLRKDFGNTKYSEIAPIFSVKVKKGDMSLIFGTLEGSLNHRLVEPLYDFERVMLNKPENGVQFLLDKKRFDMDVWINWEQMLYKGEMEQEKVSGGISSFIHLKKSDNFNFSIPLQFTAMHLGGQIDASPLPLTTKFNGNAGFKISKDFTADFIRGICFEPYYLVYKDFSNEYQDAFNSGDGLYLNFTLKTKHNNIMFSYWGGNKYISTHGGLLYNSRSTTFKYPEYNEANRRLLIVRFLTDIKISEALKITSRFEPHYDLTTDKFEFSLGMYINYNEDFFLKKLKK